VADGLLGRVIAEPNERPVRATRTAHNLILALCQDEYARLELRLAASGRWTLVKWTRLGKDVDPQSVEYLMEGWTHA
jgi:hypothetical protein